jgi:hypothetical protein
MERQRQRRGKRRMNEVDCWKCSDNSINQPVWRKTGEKAEKKN